LRNTKRRRRGRAFAVLLTVTLVAAGLLVGGGIWVVSYLRGALAPGLSVGCTATVGGTPYTLAVHQTGYAALISDISIQRGMPARAASIALATALQESKLRNIDYGDLDSVGLFQQRPSQDWGTVAQIMDPVYSTNAFYSALDKVPGYADMPLNEAAQIVQRSAFPHAYAQHESLSRAFASALTGQSPGALSCTLPPATAAGSPTAVEAALKQALGTLPVATTPGQSATTLEVAASGSMGWAVAHWAVANASQFGLTHVSCGGLAWDRNTNDAGTNVGWKGTGNAGGTVVITMAAAGS